MHVNVYNELVNCFYSLNALFSILFSKKPSGLDNLKKNLKKNTFIAFNTRCVKNITDYGYLGFLQSYDENKNVIVSREYVIEYDCVI